MTCKDCIHERACFTFHGGMARANVIGDKAETKCGLFKNKADFAEVRRSKWQPYEAQQEVIPCIGYTRVILRPISFYCLECKEISELRKPYCPKCGAKMEG